MKYKIGDTVRFIKNIKDIGCDSSRYHDKHKDHQHGRCDLKENKLIVKDVMENECLLEFETKLKNGSGNYITRLVFQNKDIEHYHAIDTIPNEIINDYNIY